MRVNALGSASHPRNAARPASVSVYCVRSCVRPDVRSPCRSPSAARRLGSAYHWLAEVDHITCWPSRIIRTRSCAPAPPSPTRVRTANEKGLSLGAGVDIAPIRRYKVRIRVYQRPWGTPLVTDIWFLHNRVRIHISAAQTDGAFALLESTGPAGDHTPLHVHRLEDEGFYVLEGEITLW